MNINLSDQNCQTLYRFNPSMSRTGRDGQNFKRSLKSADKQRGLLLVKADTCMF